MLGNLADPAIAEHSTRFFKTGPGEYGEGDQFLGIRVPVVRKVARQFKNLPLPDIEALLASPWHEERLCAVIILAEQFAHGDEGAQSSIYSLYLANTRHINNWDLVDASAHKVVGPWLEGRSRAVLDSLARSDSLWERRIAIMSTFHFIRKNEFEDTLRLAEKLLGDREDLIHKAVGWMLREVGNRDMTVEEGFLRKNYQVMPRTMLRYAIEKFPEERRKAYLSGDV